MKNLRNPKGFAMLPVIAALVFIATLITIGVIYRGSQIKAGKVTDSGSGVEGAVQAVLSFAAANQRLPIAGEFNPLLRTPNDSWGQALQYTPDTSLTATITGGACGRSSTGIAVRKCQNAGCTTFTDTSNIAFIVRSNGPNTQQQPAVIPSPFQIYDAGVVLAGLAYDDIVKYVTLEELKQKIGCYGTTQGGLKILNNELPKGCSGNTYSATLSAVGGVPFTGSSYQWSIANLPAGVTASPNAVYPAWTPASTNIQLSGTTAFGTLTVYVRDNNSPQQIVQKNLTIATATNCGGSGTVTLNNPFKPQVNGQGNEITIFQNTTAGTVTASATSNSDKSSACLWYGTPMTLTGKKLRAFFTFSFSSGEGFVLAMIPTVANDPPTHCGNDDEKMLGFNSNIPGATLLGVEFDERQNADNDPNKNHVAVDINSVNHSGSACSTTAGGQCYYNNPDIWKDNGTNYNVRVELDATISPYVLKVWLCPIGNGTCTASEITALSAVSSAPYGGSLSPVVKRTLTAFQLSDLGSFIFGFTMSQKQNKAINLTLSELKFGTF